MTHRRSTGADGAEGDPSRARRERRRFRDDDGVDASLDAVTGRGRRRRASAGDEQIEKPNEFFDEPIFQNVLPGYKHPWMQGEEL